jgi:hypothetical protein
LPSAEKAESKFPTGIPYAWYLAANWRPRGPSAAARVIAFSHNLVFSVMLAACVSGKRFRRRTARSPPLCDSNLLVLGQGLFENRVVL